MKNQKQVIKKSITFGLLVALLAGTTPSALATPGFGFTPTTLSRVLYSPAHIHMTNPDLNLELWMLPEAEIRVGANKMIPGGYSGWHSHPGPAFISIQAGTLTVYEADDPDCTPKVYTAGTGFVEIPGHVHLVRNEGQVDAEWNSILILPIGASPRIDEKDPGKCKK